MDTRHPLPSPKVPPAPGSVTLAVESAAAGSGSNEKRGRIRRTSSEALIALLSPRAPATLPQDPGSRPTTPTRAEMKALAKQQQQLAPRPVSPAEDKQQLPTRKPTGSSSPKDRLRNAAKVTMAANALAAHGKARRDRQPEESRQCGASSSAANAPPQAEQAAAVEEEEEEDEGDLDDGLTPEQRAELRRKARRDMILGVIFGVLTMVIEIGLDETFLMMLMPVGLGIMWM